MGNPERDWGRPSWPSGGGGGGGSVRDNGGKGSGSGKSFAAAAIAVMSIPFAAILTVVGYLGYHWIGS